MRCIILLSIFFLLSCSQKKAFSLDEIVDISINPAQSNQIDVLQVIESVDLIPLETNDNCLIGNVRKIKISKNYLCLLDFNGHIENPVVSQIG